MSSDGFKIYGLCLERLKHQVILAKKRYSSDPHKYNGKVIMESYNTGEIEEIIDILELYDLEDKTLSSVKDKLDDLARDASLMVMNPVMFDFTPKGHLGIYWRTNGNGKK
ncbi:MAG: hypothetical protein JSV21_01745 [Nitrospirota bacterium]|nr:MAG: hypothetical protein JSV21_01745 [Nitrospirota bacterium]